MSIDMLQSLTYWDYAVLIVVLLSVILGLLRGLVRTLAALASWVLALLGAMVLAPKALGWWAGIPSGLVMLGLFILIFVAVRILGGLIVKALSWVGLGSLDRLLGALFGIARALVILAVMVSAAVVSGLNQSEEWQASYARPLLDELAARVDPWLPKPFTGLRKA
jgi:membrane protein required for colicin V production